MKLVIKWLVCAAALLLSAQLFPGSFLMTGGFLSLFACATILWVLNIFLRPVLQVLTFPFSLITFGLFSLVVNGAVVALSAALIPGLAIHGFGVCIFAALLISIGNLIFAHRAHWAN